MTLPSLCSSAGRFESFLDRFSRDEAQISDFYVSNRTGGKENVYGSVAFVSQYTLVSGHICVDVQGMGAVLTLKSEKDARTEVSDPQGGMFTS